MTHKRLISIEQVTYAEHVTYVPLHMWPIISKGTTRSAVNIMYMDLWSLTKSKYLIRGQVLNFDINPTFEVYSIKFNNVSSSKSYNKIMFLKFEDEN